MVIYALELCTQMAQMLRGKDTVEGKIHSAFRRVCNLEFPGLPLLSVITGDISMKPLAVRVDLGPGRSLLEILPGPGAEVVLRRDQLCLGGSGLAIDLSSARAVDCGLPPLLQVGTVAQVSGHMQRLKSHLRGGNEAGALPLLNLFLQPDEAPITENLISRLVRDRLIRLFQALKRGEEAAIAAAAGQIAGCGPGLTPATDDMLIGIMASLLYGGRLFQAPPGQIQRATRAIAVGSRDKTVRLSSEMMEQAAEGYLPRSFHALMDCLFSAHGRGLREAVETVMDYGSTSGTDTLLGVYAGWQFYMEAWHS